MKNYQSNETKIITISCKICKNQKKELDKFMKILNFDSNYWFLTFGINLILEKLEEIFKNCRRDENLFKEIIFNPNANIGLKNAIYYINYLDILNLLSDIEKDRFITYLERIKLKEFERRLKR